MDTRDASHAADERTLRERIAALEAELAALRRDETERRQAERSTQELQQRFEAVFDASLDGIAIVKDNVHVLVNRAHAAMFGYEPHEVIGKSRSDLVASDDRANAVTIDTTVAGGSSLNAVEFRGLRKDGTTFSAEITISHLSLNGEDYLLGVIRDISARKRAEEELRESEAFLRQAQRLANVGSWKWDMVTNVVRWSEELCRINAYDPTRPVPTFAEMSSFYTPESWARLTAAVANAIHAGEAYELELDQIRTDGVVRRTLTRGDIDVDGSGRIVGLHGTVQDITERKQAERAIQEAQRRFQAVFDASLDGIGITRDGVHVLVNRAHAAMFGYEPQEVVGKPASELVAPDDRARAATIETKVAAGSSQGPAEFRGLRKDGTTFAAEITITPLTLNGEIHALGIIRDVSERKRAEEAIQRRDAILDAVRFAGERFLRVPHWQETIGEVLARFGEAAGVSRVVIFEIQPQPDGEVFLNWRHEWAAPGIEPRPGETQLQNLPLRAMGFERWIRELGEGRAVYGLVRDLPLAEQSGLAAQGIRSAAAVPIFLDDRWWGFIGFDHCVTESDWGGEQIDALRLAARILGEAIRHERAEAARLRLEAQLQQAQRLESVGRLAGGVAHDFNNMLAVIMGYVEVGLEQVEPSHKVHASLVEMRNAARQSADLTSRLLAFARKQVAAPRVLHLNDTVAATLAMLRRLIGEDIMLQWIPGASLWSVNVDPAQIDQILTNLCVNARDAISGVGRLTIETRNTTLDDAETCSASGAAAGDYVVLAVSDNGAGMSKPVLDRIFEPFFTTKPAGKGTGLGLAMVHGVVKQNGGFITVSSEPGAGTTFRIHLPRHLGEAARAPSSPASAMPAGRGETVLLVEDEPGVLSLATTMLQRRGYTVLAAGTPEDAIRLAREHPGEIHLLMTDVVMPGMNGRDLATQVIGLRPAIRSLFMSGYTADIIAQRGVLEDGLHFIQKPFDMQQLAAKVREVLDSESA